MRAELRARDLGGEALGGGILVAGDESDLARLERENQVMRRVFPPSSHDSTCLDLDKMLHLCRVSERHVLFQFLFK